MNVFDTEPIVAKCFEVKSLIAVYRKCAESSPGGDAEVERAGREMRLVREQILSRLLEMKRLVRRLELEVKPSL